MFKWACLAVTIILKYAKIGEYITIKESKTSKENVLMVNKAVHGALRNYVEKVKPQDEDFLFASRKGEGPLTIGGVNRLIKQWARAIHLKGNYGAHSLRKTFGFIQRTKYAVGFEVLAKRFNHSSPTITMRY